MPLNCASEPMGSSKGAMPEPNTLPQLVKSALEVSPLAVELVDEHEPRDAEVGSQPPGLLCLHLDAFDGADDEHSEVGHRKPSLDLSDKVGIPRRVDDVDLAVLIEERRQG